MGHDDVGPTDAGSGETSARPTIYDVARAAGVATSTVSRALSQPGRVSFETAEHVRRVAEEVGYRSTRIQREAPRKTSLLAVVVADITNPVFFRMIRGAERTAAHAGYSTLIIETQESEPVEREALARVQPLVDGIVLTSSRLPDGTIREVAKQGPVVVLNRIVGQVPSVTGDNVRVVLSLRDDVPLPADVQATIEAQTVLGERNVTLRRVGDTQSLGVAYHTPAGPHPDHRHLKRSDRSSLHPLASA